MSDQTPSDPSGPPQQPGWQAPAPQYGQPAYQPPTYLQQPPYGQPAYGQPGYYPPPAPPTPGKATAALVMGIASLLCCPLVLSIPAWIVGRSAVKEIDASNGALGGRSTANAGVVLGIIGTVYGVVLIVGFALLVSLGNVDCHSTDTSDGSNTSYSFHCG